MSKKLTAARENMSENDFDKKNINLLKKPVGYWLTKSVSIRALANNKNNTAFQCLKLNK